MFFGYFLNTKKVTPSADSVIGPAKAGDFPLFPHAASVPAPALAPIRSHFAPRNRAGRSSAPQGPTFCRSRHGCAAPGPQRQNPGPCSRSVAFRLRRNRAGRSLPPLGATCSLPHFRSAQMWPRARTPALASIPSAYVLFFGAFFGAKMPPPGHAFAFLPAGASFRFVSPRGRGVRHPYGSSSAAAFMVAAPVTYTLPAFLNAPDSSTTALVLPFATFTTRSATP